MGIQVYWLETTPPAVLVYEVVSPWTMDDIYAALSKAADLVNERGGLPGYLIYDVRQSTSVPPGFLNSIRYLERAREASISMRLLVGANRVINSIYRIVSRVAPHLAQSFVLVESLAEARQVIQRYHDDRPA